MKSYEISRYFFRYFFLIFIFGEPLSWKTHTHICWLQNIHRADSRFVPSQWETSLLCNHVSHWLGANLESALHCAPDSHLCPLPCSQATLCWWWSFRSLLNRDNIRYNTYVNLDSHSVSMYWGTQHILAFFAWGILECSNNSYSPLIGMGYIDCLVQDCSNSSALAMELLQSCTKPSICAKKLYF